jgi:type IV pilus assembly protein PilW
MNNINQTRGFSLVELMITLALSLTITYAIAQVLISSNRTSVTSDGISQSQETGRFVMSFLANEIRHAGLDTTDDTDTDPVISCNEYPALMNFNNIVGNHQCTFDSTLGADPAVNTGDRLAIAWAPPTPLDAAGDPQPDLIRDCTGAGGYDSGDTVLNVFWVASDVTSGMNSLFCQGHTFKEGAIVLPSNPQQTIANGVDAMHILYGEAIQPLPDADSRNVARYTHAGTPGSGGVALANWDQVYAVKVSILTRSLSDVTNAVATRRYVLLDAAPYIITDAVNRQVFNTTFAINNFPPQE